RIDRKVSRRLALRRYVLHKTQPPAVLVDREYNDAVMTSVRAIEKLATRRDLDLSAGVLARKIARQRRDRLRLLQHAMRTVVVECGDGRVQFIDHIGPPSIAMKCEMARTRTGPELEPGFAVWRQ